MAKDDEMVRRQVNLTFALLGATTPKSVRWIADNVDGYGDRSHEAAAKLVERDVADLRRLWVPAKIEDGQVWVDKDRYELAPVNLTREEATVVGLAVDLGQDSSLGAFARSGWTKLAASGATRTFDSPALASVSNDASVMDPEVFSAALACIRGTQRMSFDFHRASRTGELNNAAQRRTIDPWGIVPLHNRTYLVGWDLDRGAERIFRITKVSNVRRTKMDGHEPFHQPTRPLQEIVEEVLRGEVVDATVTLRGSGGDELAARGRREGNTVVLEAVERDWLVRTLATMAGDVADIQPDTVRGDVQKLWQHAAGRLKGDEQE